TGQNLLTIKGAPEGTHSIAFSPDGKHIVGGGATGMVLVWDAVSGQQTLASKTHNAIVLCVAFSPDGKRLASANSDATVRVADAVTGAEVLLLKGRPQCMFKHVNYSS